MHRFSNNGRTTVCGRPLRDYVVLRTKLGARVVPLRATDLARAVRCAECKAIVAQYEAVYGPYSEALSCPA